MRGVHVGVLHRTNSAGVRGPEFSPRVPRGTFRIVLAGDSIAMGHGIEEDERYSAVLERILQEHLIGGRPVEDLTIERNSVCGTCDATASRTE